MPKRKKIKNLFLSGIISAMPIVVTVYLVLFVYRTLKGLLLPYLNKALVYFEIDLTLHLQEFISFVLVIFLIYMVGFLTKLYFGRKLMGIFDKLFATIPVVRIVYNAAKQIADAFQSTTGGDNFQKVIMLQYPRKGIYSIGFVTKDSSDFFANKTGVESYNVFVPTTPNPTSGFIIIVPKADVIELGISVEEGIKFVISVGLVEPSLPLLNGKGNVMTNVDVS